MVTFVLVLKRDYKADPLPTKEWHHFLTELWRRKKTLRSKSLPEWRHLQWRGWILLLHQWFQRTHMWRWCNPKTQKKYIWIPTSPGLQKKIIWKRSTEHLSCLKKNPGPNSSVDEKLMQWSVVRTNKKLIENRLLESAQTLFTFPIFPSPSTKNIPLSTDFLNLCLLWPLHTLNMLLYCK